MLRGCSDPHGRVGASREGPLHFQGLSLSSKDRPWPYPAPLELTQWTVVTSLSSVTQFLSSVPPSSLEMFLLCCGDAQLPTSSARDLNLPSPSAAPTRPARPTLSPASETSSQPPHLEKTSPSSCRPPGSHSPAQPCFPGVGLLMWAIRCPLPRSRILLPHRETHRRAWSGIFSQPHLSVPAPQRSMLGFVPICRGGETLPLGLWRVPPEQKCLPCSP